MIIKKKQKKQKTKQNKTKEMSVALLFAFLCVNVLFLVTPSNACASPGVCQIAGSWRGRDTGDYLTIKEDSTFCGQLLGLYVTGVAVVNIGVTPFAIDLHINTGAVFPAIWRLETELDGTVVLVLGLVENLLNLLLGVVLRPLGFTPLNSLYFVRGLPVVGLLNAPPPSPPPVVPFPPFENNNSTCAPTLRCGDCKNMCSQFCLDLQEKGKTCTNKCRDDMCQIFCE